MTPSRRPDSFYALGVRPALAAALEARGITEPFPIQAASLPDSLSGRDVLGRGRTGSGKTVAFALPLLERILTSGTRREPKRPRALVLVPTRELAVQVADTVDHLAASVKLKAMTVFGGVRYTGQMRKLERGVDVVVATPGRLEDLIEQGALLLDAVEVVVLDEADMMADMGFLPPVTRILQGVPAGQRMLFSATLDGEVGTLVSRFLSDPATHSMDAHESAPDAEHFVFGVTTENKFAVVRELLAGGGRTLVFTRTKAGAERLAKELTKNGIPAVELHGNLRQGARQRNLASFADGSVAALVATDIAARGIHVDDVGLVVHVDPPNDPKAYLHRSGRTARAGSDGTVVTLATRNQNKTVRGLLAEAKIKAKTVNVAPGDELISEVRAVRIEPSRSRPSIFEPDPEDVIEEPTLVPRDRQRAGGREALPERQRAWGRGDKPDRRDERRPNARGFDGDGRGKRERRDEAPGIDYRPRREPKEHTSGARGPRPEHHDTHPQRHVRRGEWTAEWWGPEPWEVDDRPARPAYGDRGRPNAVAGRPTRGFQPRETREGYGSDEREGQRRRFDGAARGEGRRPRFEGAVSERDERRPRVEENSGRRDDRRPRFERELGRDDRRPGFEDDHGRRDDRRRPGRDAQSVEPGKAASTPRVKNRWTAADRARAAESASRGFGFKKAVKSSGKPGAKGAAPAKGGAKSSAKAFGAPHKGGATRTPSGKGKSNRGSGAKKGR